MTTLHHTHDAECPLCKQKLSTAHPRLRDWYLIRVKPAHPGVHISWAWRGKEDQEKFFQEKKTTKHFPDSPHNHMLEDGTPCSLALDLFLLTADNRALFPSKIYATIAQEAESQRDPIFWGGHFKSLGDADHFQFRELHPLTLASNEDGDPGAGDPGFEPDGAA
jgi:hypothetical protein